jgi:hypothetical protein
VWVQFTDPDTDIVKGQLVEDSFERYYFCSPTTGPQFNTYARLRDGLSMMNLGVPQVPSTTAFQPGIALISGGTAPVVTRAFVYTWVNIYGEESVPSLPVTGSGNANAVWTISNILDPTTEFTGFAGYQKKRLYRTITGASGQTTYYRVVELAPGVTSYADNGAVLTDAILANNLLLESTSWSPPVSTMKGFIAMPNGFLIGFDGNTIYMSDLPFPRLADRVQAGDGNAGRWPWHIGPDLRGVHARLSVDDHGSQPATCSFTKATTGEPCLSRGSIVSGTQGVVYASQNGLMLIGPGGISNVTSDLITKDEWTKDYAPAYLRAVRYQNGYLALRMPPLPSPRSGFYLDPSDLNVALTELSDFDSCVALNVDFWSGEVFWLQAGLIKHWDPPTNDLMPVQWKSKEFQYQFQENFGAYAIYWDDARYSSFNWGTSIMPTTEHVRFIVYADRRKVYDQPVLKNGRAIRLPSGFKADIWQFEIKARAPVYTLHVASTMKELKGA